MTTRRPGEQLGDYALVELLGQGGSGEAWRAENAFTGMEAAVKLCHGPELREALLNEAKSLGALRQASAEEGFPPELARLWETHLSHDPPFLVMEYCPGGDLRRVLQEKEALSPKVVAAWTAQIARGLAWAHGRGISHRDIKPENILLAEPWKPGRKTPPRVKVADFGLGRAAATQALSIHRSLQSGPSGGEGGGLGLLEGTSSGTLEYMSPEQLEGKPPTPSTDIYSLGVVVFELLTGKRPRGNVLPSRLRPDLAKDWDELFDRCYRFNPEDRFESAEELAQFVEERFLGAGKKGASNKADPPENRGELAAIDEAFAGEEDADWKPRGKAQPAAREESDPARDALRRETLRRVASGRFFRLSPSQSGEHAESYVLSDGEGNRVGQWTHQEAYEWPENEPPRRARDVENIFRVGKRAALLGFALSIFLFRGAMIPMLSVYIAMILIDAFMGDILRGIGGKRSRAVLHAFGNLKADIARVSASPNNRQYLAVLDSGKNAVGYVHTKKREMEVIDANGNLLGAVRPARGSEEFAELPKKLAKKSAFYPAGAKAPTALFGRCGKEPAAVFLDDSLDAPARLTLLNLALALVLKRKGSWSD